MRSLLLPLLFLALSAPLASLSLPLPPPMDPADSKALADVAGCLRGWPPLDAWAAGNGTCDDWIHVECDEEGHVTRLTLQGILDLEGMISPSIGNLTHLKSLTFSLSSITGIIPSSIGLLVNLVTLVLSHLELTGEIPESLKNLVNLEVLDLSTNPFQTSLPDLSGLTKLKELTLNNISLDGGFPMFLTQLTNLVTLDLGHNNISGPIPSEIENLSNLDQLWLFDNKFNGTIPDSIGKLTNVSLIYLYENDLVGGIPLTFENLTKLTALDLHGNNLSGPLPPYICDLPKMRLSGSALDVSHNQLSGTIPENIGNLQQIATLLLSDNLFVGSLPPSMANLTNLFNLSLSNNYLTGDILFNLTYTIIQLDFHNNYFTGPIGVFDINEVCPQFLQNDGSWGNSFQGNCIFNPKNTTCLYGEQKNLSVCVNFCNASGPETGGYCGGHGRCTKNNLKKWECVCNAGYNNLNDKLRCVEDIYPPPPPFPPPSPSTGLQGISFCPPQNLSRQPQDLKHQFLRLLVRLPNCSLIVVFSHYLLLLECSLL